VASGPLRPHRGGTAPLSFAQTLQGEGLFGESLAESDRLSKHFRKRLGLVRGVQLRRRMNAALADLVAEHRIIARVLKTLEHWAGSVARRGADARSELQGFTDFFSRFADEHHHDKEERVLFEVMIEHGVPREEGPLGMMFREHEQCRASTRQLVELAHQHHPWSDADRGALCAAASNYSKLLLLHMSKEDEFLYPMVTRQLPPVLQRVAQEFSRFKTHETGEDEYRRLLLLAESLVARHGPRAPGRP